MTDKTAPRRSRSVVIFLWLLPLWLMASGGFGLWWYFRKQAAEEKVEQIRFSTAVGEKGLQDDVGKFIDFVRERHTGSPEGLQGLKRAAAMIEGSLGPANAGYRVESVLSEGGLPAGGAPILIATLRGRDPAAAPLWVLAAYDARPGSVGVEANATGVASVLAAAHALAGATPQRSVVFAFLPHAYDPEGPMMQTLEALSKRIRKASQVLVVESTGTAEKLVISSRDAGNRALTSIEGLGEVVGAESICLEDDFDLSSILFESGLPAVRVATRAVVKAEEPDEVPPDPAIHAAATAALAELIRRLSDS